MRNLSQLCTSASKEVREEWAARCEESQKGHDQAVEKLRALGVKLIHPDDGWVDRRLNCLNPCYPSLDLSPQFGDLIALGWHFSGFRLCRVVYVAERVGLLKRGNRYYFDEVEKIDFRETK